MSKRVTLPYQLRMPFDETSEPTPPPTGQPAAAPTTLAGPPATTLEQPANHPASATELQALQPTNVTEHFAGQSVEAIEPPERRHTSAREPPRPVIDSINPIDLLVAPWLTVRTVDGTTRYNLPELLVAMNEGRVVAFPALRPHQAATFHVFLVQVTVMALEGTAAPFKSGVDPMRPWTAIKPHSVAEWEALLRGLAPDAGTAWQLVVDDIVRPAFLQPPVPEGTLKGFKPVGYPDEADTLISSQNHDVKSAALVRPTAEDWIFALISLQTNSGYMGHGNYGIVRQNGGYGSRPIFTLQSSSNPSARWARDVWVLLDELERGGERIYSVCNNRSGARLLWLEPWDGTAESAYSVEDIHPLCVEICRRVRMTRGEDGPVLLKKPTKTSRFNKEQQENLKGNLGDPWEPLAPPKETVKKRTSRASTDKPSDEGPKVLNAPPKSATIAQILGNPKLQPLLMNYHAGIDPENSALWCSIINRGQGETDGYYERVIPLDTDTCARSLDDDPTLANAARAMIESSYAARRVLKSALIVAMTAAENGESGWVKPIGDTIEPEIDGAFFDHIWKVAKNCLSHDGEVTDEDLVSWHLRLCEIVRRHYETGIKSLPCSASRRIRARALSRARLDVGLARGLPIPEKEMIQ